MTGLTKAGRLAEFLTAENYQNENRFPNGRSGDQIDQAGIAKYGEKMDNADTEPESGDETVCDHF